jgi:hypothetical protein
MPEDDSAGPEFSPRVWVMCEVHTKARRPVRARDMALDRAWDEGLIRKDCASLRQRVWHRTCAERGARRQQTVWHDAQQR